jgi:hypothetical protein
MSYVGTDITTSLQIAPVSKSNSGTASGAVLSRTGYKSATFIFMAGAASGSPTAISVACKVQTGNEADGSDMADISGATATITAENTAAEINVDLSGCKKYIRAYLTVTLTGGSSPSILVAAAAVLGDAKYKPV